MSYKRQELLTLRGHLGSLPLFEGSVLLIFSEFCVVFFALFVIVPCLFYPNVASFSGLSILDFPFGFL